MSRGQQQTVADTAGRENKTYNTDANTSFSTAQQDVTGYGDELSKFKANNPYVTGGVAETADNQQLADTAAGIARSGGQAVQGAAVRTGQNPGGAIAATEEMGREAQRTLGSQEAGATERRLAAGTGYQEAGLEGTAQQESMQDKLAREQAEAAQGALGTQEQASNTPSFGDVFGDAFGQAAGKFLGGGNLSLSKSV